MCLNVWDRITQSGFFTGAKDAKIVRMDVAGSPMLEYMGHELTVNDLSQPYKESLVSGSWDG